jgi:Holliday junction DNA helicase RuvB
MNKKKNLKEEFNFDDLNELEITSKLIPEKELEYDIQLRPQHFSEFIGQKVVLENISLIMESSKIRQKAMDHVLLSGPPGLGKTSLANLIALELGSSIHTITGPMIDKKADLAAILTNLNQGDILFIDEIHRLPKTIEEILYSAMEDFRLDIVLGVGPSARTMKIDLAPFTLIGATTRSGFLSRPLRERFLAHLNFDFYNEEEMSILVEQNLKKLNIISDVESIRELALRSRFTPRIANRVLRRIRDYICVHDLKKLNLQIVHQACKIMALDNMGLEILDRKILLTIKNQFQGGPVGIETLSSILNESRETLEEVHEPFLMKMDLIQRTPRGRIITDKGFQHLEQIS